MNNNIRILKEALINDALALEFLDNPDLFEATETTLVQIYDRAYGQSDDWLRISKDARIKMAKARVSSGEIKNLKIEIVWGYSSTAGKDRAIIKISAMCLVEKNGVTEWKQIQEGGISFLAKDFIRRKILQCSG